MAPAIILGELRTGFFTPTEAAVGVVFYGFFVGLFVYKTLNLSKIFRVLVEAAEISAVVLIIIALARFLLGFTDNETLMIIMTMTLAIGQFTPLWR